MRWDHLVVYILHGGWAGSFKSVRQSIRNHMPVHMQALETRMRGSSEDSSDKSRHNSGPAAMRLDAPLREGQEELGLCEAHAIPARSMYMFNENQVRFTTRWLTA